MRRTEKFTLFWGGPFSNWFKRDFKVKGITFNCGEQYMMYSKAMLFNDLHTAQLIMKTPNPKRQKELGRLVKGYDDEVWKARAPSILAPGLFQKFIQHQDLTDIILQSLGTRLVEASPSDRLWGVGLHEDDPRAWDESTWLGLNGLGKVLDRVRDRVVEHVAAKDCSPGQG
ncbi:NADAR family protein [Pseudomonas fluorescens]|uniref:NADAR family protein n=1 Tax=Pseudomonas fluorescens TaxID=294 RepID=UPI00177E6C84|nr:NADAR family protein [Pseudomonas fluorescens]MBD8088456.1 NADAR family protein [Pseudomonas fluorescens]MBD8615097.1 NADAR family protein [Pseudomonas putida]